MSERAAAWARAQGAEGLPVVRSLDALGASKVVLVVRNARAGSRLLAQLVGTPETEVAATSVEVERAVAAAGLTISARGHLADDEPSEHLPLPRAAAKAIVAFLRAVQPESAAGFFLFTVAPGAAALPERIQDDLVSAVVRWPGRDEDALDATLFALACQRQRPIEIVVEAPKSALDAARRLLDRHAPLGTFEGVVAIEGEAAPRGRYLSLLDAGDLVHPQHLAALRAALTETAAAFALARGRAVRVAAGEAGPYVEAKLDQPDLPKDVAGLLRPGSLAGPAALFDRTRIGGSSVNDPDLGPSDRGAALARRLLSFTRPAIVAGVPSWERPERIANEPCLMEFPLLLSPPELDASMSHAPVPSWLRYRVADAVSDALRRAGPLGPLLKSIAARWRRR